MQEAINGILQFLSDYPGLFFGAVGYFNGSLFRQVSVLKVVIILVVVSFCLQILIAINSIFIATIPFLLGALIGYWGLERTRHYALMTIDLTRDQIDRFR